MRLLVQVGVVGIALALAVRPCAAGLVLSVVEDAGSTADLSNLQPGQTITFDVNLSGLDTASNQTLGTLGATVVFDGNLLGTPTAITPGAIVPNDPSAFSTATALGLADATYSIDVSMLTSPIPISQNGTFFTFQVTVEPGASGAGTVSLNPTEGGFVSAFDPTDNPVDIAPGADVPISAGGPAATPEPATYVPALIGLVGLGTYLSMKRYRG